MPEASPLLVHHEPLNEESTSQVRVLTLNRPEVRNALSPALLEALTQAVSDAKRDPEVRALVLTGSGKAFCAGLDLSELKAISQRSSEENRADSERLATLLELLYTFPKPVVAALNGHAVGGGAGLASVCDVIVMSEAAKLGYTETRIGFVPALVSIFLLRQIGEKRARELLLSARLIGAQEAQTLGLINQVVPADEVLARGLEHARGMAQNAPSSLALTKSLLAALPSMGLHEALRFAVDTNTLARTTDDLAEGVSAFLEKREPSWKR